MRRWMMAVALGATTLSLVYVPDHAKASVPEVQSCTARPELGPGSRGDDVHCLQYLLIILGYPVGYTGVFDQRTTTAVRAYQYTHPPLNADGIAGEQTLLSLGIRTGLNPAPSAATTQSAGAGPTTVAQREENELELPSSTLTCLADAELINGSRGQSVTCLQRRLLELGLFRGTVTGVFDGPLAGAVKAFQSTRPPLNPDGRAGPRTLAALGIWSGISPRHAAPGAPVGAGPFPASVQPEKLWNVTVDGIPFFSNHRACSPNDAAIVANEFAIDGADAATQQWAVYIASREGGCRPEAVNINPATRDDSHCSFQLNALSGAFEPHGSLGRRGWTAENVMISIQACADAASDLWVFCGRGPWTPPYACRPPWVGAAEGQAPANVPVAVPPGVSATDPTTIPTTDPTTDPTTNPAATNPATGPPDAEPAPIGATSTTVPVGD